PALDRPVLTPLRAQHRDAAALPRGRPARARRGRPVERLPAVLARTAARRAGDRGASRARAAARRGACSARREAGRSRPVAEGVPAADRKPDLALPARPLPAATTHRRRGEPDGTANG